MKITKARLKKIIKEELEGLAEIDITNEADTYDAAFDIGGGYDVLPPKETRAFVKAVKEGGDAKTVDAALDVLVDYRERKAPPMARSTMNFQMGELAKKLGDEAVLAKVKEKFPYKETPRPPRRPLNLRGLNEDAKLDFPLSEGTPERAALNAAYKNMSEFHEKNPSDEGRRVLDLLVSLNAAIVDAEASLYRN